MLSAVENARSCHSGLRANRLTPAKCRSLQEQPELSNAIIAEWQVKQSDW